VRVVHLSTLHPALDERIFVKQCRSLAEAGHEVHLVVPEPPASEAAGVRLHHFDRPATALRPLRIARRLTAMYRQAAALRAQVYHFHDPELIPVGLLLRRSGAKAVYDVHEHSAQEALTVNKERPWEGRWKSCALAALESVAIRLLDAFVCATPAIAESFPPGRTITVRNFPRLDEFAPAANAISYADRPHHLAYTGSISGVRGIREMICALEGLASLPDVRLQLAGTFAEPHLLAEMEKLPGWRRVAYLGQQPRSAIQSLLASARLGLVLYHPEPDHLAAEPNKLFEYMAAGLPVIASDFPHWRQIIQGAGCGLLVDPLEPAAIARAIEHLLTHPRQAEAMGQRGRRAVRDAFNWDREADKLLGLYERFHVATKKPVAGAPG
jgi:glycosyltransferase involved in cell wall biosynthesis